MRLQRDDVAFEPIKGIPDKCSFCEEFMEISPFHASSIDKKAVMCDECIKKQSVLRNLTRIRGMYGDEDKWATYASDVRMSIPIGLSVKSRLVIERVSLLLATRSSDILVGRPPRRSRLLLRGSQVGDLYGPLSKVLQMGGALTRITEFSDINNGALQLWRNDCLCHRPSFEHAVLFIRGGYVPLQFSCVIIYAVNQDFQLPSSCPVIDVDGYALSETN